MERPDRTIYATLDEPRRTVTSSGFEEGRAYGELTGEMKALRRRVKKMEEVLDGVKPGDLKVPALAGRFWKWVAFVLAALATVVFRWNAIGKPLLGWLGFDSDSDSNR